MPPLPSEKTEKGDSHFTAQRPSFSRNNPKWGKYARVEAGNTGREQVPESSIVRASPTAVFLVP